MKNQINGFVIADSMVGLMIISIAIILFCFNQSCYIKMENKFYIKNLLVHQAYVESTKILYQNRKIKKIIISGKNDRYEIYKIKN
ncbi:hypothetical protein [Ligilactobacillus cholophilus]|uniref:hypothetical protein n=1 Tax=Ligilactobacillus cholophilus TaxID=3050131 RepID=UPI0025B17B04|nr:hypothetical protein [Ligilactobacillus cholophilus]